MTKGISFLEHFRGLPEPRIVGMVTYPLDEILLATLVGVVCGAEDWEEITLFAREHIKWLRKFLSYDSGIASEQTFRSVFRLLDADCFARCFTSWVASLSGHVKGVIAIDGKTLRGSKQDSSGKGALHMLSAFAHEAGLVIGQCPVDGKSNEITAIPELLDSLELSRSIVTIDAMGCQKNIAAKIVEKEADYLLALKGNQGSLHDDVRLFCEEKSREVAWHTHDTTDGDHGRIEERSCMATDDIAWLKDRHDWPGLSAIVQITSIRTDKKSGASTRETRYYITSLPPHAEQLLAATRAHWSIENTLHWSLDVTFREDANRTRKDNAALNLAIVRHSAFNLLKQSTEKLSLKKKQCKAAWNQHYRKTLIAC